MTQPRIPSLDGLRAISILMVVGSHLYVTVAPERAQHLNLGNLGVRVFFVISGFLITGLLLAELEKKRRIDLPKFYFRRTLRIFPPYYFFLLVMAVVAAAGWVSWSSREFLASALYVSNYVDTTWYLGHTWSLSVEEQFYLLWPGLLAVAGKRRAFFTLCAIIIIAPLMRVAVYQYSPTLDPFWFTGGFHGNMDSLAAGCVLAFMRERLHSWGTYRAVLNTGFFIFVPLFILVANTMHMHPILFFGLCVTGMNLGIALSIDWAVTHHEGIIGRALNSKPAVFIGVMSYSIYLWQQPILFEEGPQPLMSPLTKLVLLAIASLISYYAVERLSLRLRHKLEVKWFGRETKGGAISLRSNYGAAGKRVI